MLHVFFAEFGAESHDLWTAIITGSGGPHRILIPMLFTSPDPAADPYYARILLGLRKAAYAVEAELIATKRCRRASGSPG